MTPEEKLEEINKRLDEAMSSVKYLEECRREHINRHDLNKDKL